MENIHQTQNRAALVKLREAGQSVPFLDNEPPLYPHFEWVWAAWDFLCDTRGWNERGPQAVRLQDILSFADHIQVMSESGRDDLVYLINLLDRIYRSHYETMRQKAARAAANKTGGGGPPPPRRPGPYRR